MRKRNGDYTASMASLEYDVGGHCVRLLPGVDMIGLVELSKRFESLVDDAGKRNLLSSALLAFYLWDDPNYEFSVENIDPDSVLDLEGDDLLSAAMQCYGSIHCRESMRAGFHPGKILGAVVSILSGNADGLGKEIPAEIKPSA